MIGYVLFVAVTATLFVRPAELLPSLAGWPIYEVLILSCLAVSIAPVVRQFSPSSLASSPITVCVLGVWVAIVLSHLSHGFIWGARMSGFAFFKVMIFYLLGVATITTVSRLENYLKCLFALTTAVAVMGIFSFHRIVEISAISVLQENAVDPLTGDLETIPRIRSTGIFNDPNDLAMMLSGGVAIGGGIALRSRLLLKFLWLPPVAVLVYGIFLTQSRGGMLSLLAALGTLFYFRWGWKRACVAGVFVLAAVAALSGGRLARLDEAATSGTAQSRVQLWSMTFRVFRQNPVFGLGQGLIADELDGLVTHNSYLQCYGELGFVGGTCFLGMVFASVMAIRRLCEASQSREETPSRRSTEIIAAVLTAFGVAMLSISRPYVATPYIAFALVAASVRVNSGPETRFLPRFDARFIAQLVVASVATIACAYAFVRLTAKWN